jgi:hypothetical protein
VLLILPQRKINAILKSALVWIPVFKGYFETAQANNQILAALQARQNNTSSMQSQQQISLPPWTPSEEEGNALKMVAILMAKSTPEEDHEGIRAECLKNMSEQEQQDMTKTGGDPMIEFFRSQALEDHRRQRTIAMVINGPGGQGQEPGSFLRGNANVIAMPEADFVAIRKVLEYIRNGSLMNSDSSTADGQSATLFTRRLVYTYNLAEKTGLEQLGNLMVDRLLLHYQPPFRANWLDIVGLRNKGLGDSRMRRMLLQQILSDIYQHGWDGYLRLYKYEAVDFLQWLEESGPDASELLRLLIDFAKTQECPDRPSDGNACKWHRHDKTPRCAAGEASGGEP